MKTRIDQPTLTRHWKTYINDSSIFSKESFGRYVHDRMMVKGWAWPKLYYAKSEAYDLVWKHIHHGYEGGIRKVV